MQRLSSVRPTPSIQRVGKVMMLGHYPNARRLLTVLPSSSSSSLRPLSSTSSIRLLPALHHHRRYNSGIATSPPPSPAPPSSSVPSSSSSPTPSTGPSWVQRLRVGAKALWDQYWGGSRQLWYDARAARELRRQVRDDPSRVLSRREERFLRRVRADLHAVVPFAILFMLPFSAYALPFVVRLFPGLLPSTYLTPSDRIEKLQKRQKVKNEAAVELKKALTQRLHASSSDLQEPAPSTSSSFSTASSDDLHHILTSPHQAASSLAALRHLDTYISTQLHLPTLRHSPAASLTMWERWRAWTCPPDVRALCTFHGITVLPVPGAFERCVRLLTEHGKLIKHDDELLLKEKQMKVKKEEIQKEEQETDDGEMTLEELVEACDQRGLNTDEAHSSRTMVKQQLEGWVDEFGGCTPPVSLELVLFAGPLTSTPPSEPLPGRDVRPAPRSARSKQARQS